MNQQRPVAVVTGAGRGVGRAIAEELAGAGFDLALIGRTREPLQEVAELCAGSGAKAKVFVFDLERTGDIAPLVQRIGLELGGINVLVNNAAIFLEREFKETSPEDFRRSFDVNYFAVVELIRAALPFIEEGVGRGTHGALINIGSVAGERGYARGTMYSPTKHALKGLTESLFAELRETGVKVSLVEPGLINTDMHAGDPRYDPARMIQPEDVAQAVRFILEAPPTVCPSKLTLVPQREPRRAGRPPQF